MKNITMEIIQPEQFQSIVSYMPNPAQLLNDRKGFYETIDEMLTDSVIGSHLRLRKDIVTSFPFVITQRNASDAVYQFVKDRIFEGLSFENDTKEFLSAVEYGFSFSEALWRIDEQGWKLPDSLRNKYPDKIGFKPEIVKTNGGSKSIWTPVLTKTKEPLYDNFRFLVYRNNPRAENPYGSSDLFMCYWPWKFKQLSWDFWLRAARKSGAPSVLALFDAPDDEKAKEKAAMLSKTLAEAEGGDGLAFANVKEVKTLEMGGALRDHQTLIETCNREISFALTTQSLSTQEGEYGTRAQATVHDENLVRVCHGDAKALQSVYQQLIDWTVALNFGPKEPTPKGEFDLKQYATFTEIIQAIQAKIPMSRDVLYSRYGLPIPKDDADVFVMPDTAPGLALSDTGKKKAPRSPMLIH